MYGCELTHRLPFLSMSRKSEFDRVLLVLSAAGCIVLLFNLYFYGRGLFGGIPLIGPSIDYIVICLYREGVFDSPSLSKGIAAVLFFSSLSFRKGGESPLSWTSIGVMFALGMGLYIWPYTSSSAYVAGTIAGFILCGAMISSAARKGSALSIIP